MEEGGARTGRSTSGEGGGNGSDPFPDGLAGVAQVGAPVEFHPDHGDADAGGGPDASDTGGPVDGGLDGNGHLGLHLGGRHTVGLGEDGDAGCGEVREDIDRHAGDGAEAGHGEDQGGDQHEGAVGQGPMDESVHEVISGCGRGRG